MRIENVSTPKIAKSDQPASKGGGLELGRGDTFKARVLFSENGSVNLRLADGQMVRARMEGDVQLQVGQEVELTVTDTENGVISLALADDGQTLRAENPQAAQLAAIAGDKQLAPLARQLQALNLPVTRETVTAMAQILKDNPSMPPRQAAFLAANKIVPQSQSVLDAALALLDGRGDTGRMLAQLAEALGGSAQPGAQPQAAPVLVPQSPLAALEAAIAAASAPAREAAPGQATPAQGQMAQALAPQPQGQAPRAVSWIDLVEALLGQGAPQGAAAAEGQAPASGAQSTVSVPQEGVQAPVLPGAETLAEAQPAPNAPMVAESNAPAAAPPADAGVAPQAPVQAPAQEAAAPAQAAESHAAAPQAAPSGPESPVNLLQRMLEMPAFDGVGEGRLAQLADMLESAGQEIARVLSLPGQEQAAGLQKFVDSMFARIDGWQDDSPALLKKAKEELFVRLTLVQEAITQARVGDRPALAEQTQKLMNHIKLLGQIDQFSYVQLPIMQGGEQKTAELYIYQNKKKSRRIDPENVRILLALDLQYMGHVQAFVAIRGREVSLRLDVERQPLADYFRTKTVDLYTILSESGYKLAENRVQVAEEPVTVEKAMLALAEFEARPSGFDLKV